MAFYKPISRWTRNRRTHSALNNLGDDLQESCNADETVSSEDGSSDLNSVVDSHSHQTYETHSIESKGMNSSHTSNTTTVNSNDHEDGCHLTSESDADVSISYMSDDETGAYSADVETELLAGSVYESDSDIEELNLVDDLAQWAIQFNISHSALRSLLRLLRKCHPDLPKDPRTVLQTCTAVSALTIAGGSYYHFGLVNWLINILDCKGVVDDTIKLQINIDGLPLCKSTSAQFWPILGLVTNSTARQPFVIGLFYGDHKPASAADYLKELVAELTVIQRQGLAFRHKMYTVQLVAVVCDTPARAFVKNIKGHTGYSGCDKCTHDGVYFERRMTFPDLNASLRTDDSFRTMVDEDHHLGPCPLTDLNIGMVSNFPLDYMHLSCLGVMRRLLNLWIKGPLAIRIGPQAVRKLSEALILIKNQVPSEFARKPRQISELDRWKATELRQFMLYTGPVCLKGILSETMYSNFMLFSVGMFILLSPSLCLQYRQFAGDLLKLFVQNVGELYGQETLTYNMHATVHLAEEVALHGNLDNVSGFVFENYLGKLKKMIRTPNAKLQQVVKRLSERCMATSNMEIDILQKEHENGPLLRPLNVCKQFKEYHQKGYKITLSCKDNCILVNGAIALAHNFVTTNEGQFVIYQRFTHLQSFYTYPVESNQLGVHSASRLDKKLLISPLSEITNKCVLLSGGGQSVAVPLLHVG